MSPNRIFTIKISTNQKSHPEMFCKKGVLRNFAKLTGNFCIGVSLLVKLQDVQPY